MVMLLPLQKESQVFSRVPFLDADSSQTGVLHCQEVTPMTLFSHTALRVYWHTIKSDCHGFSNTSYCKYIIYLLKGQVVSSPSNYLSVS